MIRLKFLLPALVLALPALVAKADPCAPLNSSYGQAAAGTNCNTLITISANGTATITYPNSNPYDGSDDNYVGVINNSSSAINSITLSSTANIFGFDQDGIDEFGVSGNSMDLSAQNNSGGYGGPNAYFTNLNCTFDGFGDCYGGAGTTGTVNFITAIAANGGTGYFSLEEAPDVADQTGVTGTGTGPSTGVTPEPGSLALFGTGALGLVGAARRRLRK